MQSKAFLFYISSHYTNTCIVLYTCMYMYIHIFGRVVSPLWVDGNDQCLFRTSEKLQVLILWLIICDSGYKMRGSSNIYMKASIWLMPLYMRDFREFKTSKISASETPAILNLGTQMHRKRLLWHLKNFF